MALTSSLRGKHATREPHSDPVLMAARRARVEHYRAQVSSGQALFEEGPPARQSRAKAWCLICCHCDAQAAITRITPRPPGWRVFRVCERPVAECPACLAAWDAVHGGYDRLHGKVVNWVTPHVVRDQRGRHRKRKAVLCG